MKTKSVFLLSALVFGTAVSARGELVHVCQQTVAGTSTNQLSDTVLETGASYAMQEAPAISGFIFTHWSISTAQTYSDRDRWGRAWDAAPYTLYENTTLTANYLPDSEDSDADGVADGHEIYWYGSLAASAQSDTDGDGAFTVRGTGGAVEIHFSDTDEPPVVSIPAAAAEGYERREVSVPVRIATSDALDRSSLSLTGTWDAEALEFVRFDAAEGFDGGLETASPSADASQGGGGLQSAVASGWRIAGTAGVVPKGTATLGSLVFLALDVVSDTQTQILVTGGAAESTEGVEAAGVPSASIWTGPFRSEASLPIPATRHARRGQGSGGVVA